MRTLRDFAQFNFPQPESGKLDNERTLLYRPSIHRDEDE